VTDLNNFLFGGGDRMKTKTLTFILSFIFLFLFSGSVYGDDLQDGLDAYKRKDYKTAYKLLLPLADSGNLRAKRRLKVILRRIVEEDKCQADEKCRTEKQITEEQNIADAKAAEEIAAEARKALCSKKFTTDKNMITVKGFYIGMNICDAEKLVKEGKYKSVFKIHNISIRNILKVNNEGKVTEIYFPEELLNDLFKSKDMSLATFAENFGKHYIKGKFMFEMEPHNDFTNNNIGYKYYNGEVGYKFFIKQNESGNGAESLKIEEVAKISEGFGD
jgi:hypothetical protein